MQQPLKCCFNEFMGEGLMWDDPNALHRATAPSILFLGRAHVPTRTKCTRAMASEKFSQHNEHAVLFEAIPQHEKILRPTRTPAQR